MGFAASNRVGLYTAPETAFGVTPSTPALSPIRMTSESLNFNITNTVSQEIRDDRMSSGAIQTSAESSGDINFELSYGSFDHLIEAAFTSKFLKKVPPLTGIEVDGTTKTFVGTFSASDPITAEQIRVGSHFVVKGATNEANNGVFRIEKAEVDTTALTVTLTVLEPVTTETAPVDARIGFTQMLKNGVEEPSFFVQKFLQDADEPTYINFMGMRVNGMSLNISTGSIVTGSFSFMGTASEARTTQIAGATILPRRLDEAMNAVSDVHNVLVDEMPTGCFNNLTFTVTNNLRGQDCVGKLGHVGIAYGTIEITGNIALYFRNSYDYDKYVNAAYSSLAFRIEDGSGDFYIIRIPRMKYDTGKITAGGRDQDVMFEATYRAEVDPQEQSLAIIERFDNSNF